VTYTVFLFRTRVGGTPGQSYGSDVSTRTLGIQRGHRQPLILINDESLLLHSLSAMSFWYMLICLGWPSPRRLIIAAEDMVAGGRFQP
jgi:hypothetical protein